MGTYDSYVDTKLGWYLPETYQEKGLGNAAAIWLEYAGHGADGYFGSTYMQTHLYYMEHFMVQHC